MSSNVETIDYDTRLVIWRKAVEIQSQLNVVEILCNENSCSSIETCFVGISNLLDDIKSLSFQGNNPDQLMASPAAAMQLFKKISEYELNKQVQLAEGINDEKDHVQF